MSRPAIHTRPNNGMSVEWLTPPWIIEALGPFGLDPCAHPQQFYRTASHMISPPADGLEENWGRRRVWLNPPYGRQIDQWMKRMVEHRKGIALVPSRTEVERWFWPYVWEAAAAVLFLKGRLFFHKPDGTTAGNAGHGSVLAAYSLADAVALQQSGIPGKLIPLTVS